MHEQRDRHQPTVAEEKIPIARIEPITLNERDFIASMIAISGAPLFGLLSMPPIVCRIAWMIASTEAMRRNRVVLMRAFSL